MNDAYLRVTMRTHEELIGRRMFDEFPSDPQSDSYRLLKGSFDRVLSQGEVDEIALLRYDIRNLGGQMDVHYWSATHTPLKDDRGQVAYILQHTVDVTELEGLRRLRDEMGLVQRANAIQARNLDLSEETDRLKSLFEQAPGFVTVLSGPEYRFVTANGTYRDLVGDRDLIGRPLAEALPEVVGQGFIELLDKVRQTGEPFVGRRSRILLEKSHFEKPERFLDFIYQPILGHDGQVDGVFVQGHDVAEQVEAEERQRLLINELNHRVKNTLSIVQGLAMQSFRSIEGSEKARQTFEARLHALAAAHSMLTVRNWEEACLLETLSNSVAATTGADAERFRLEGPDVALPPQVAVGLAMIVHELCTNAIKYGALWEPSGRVDIRWSIENGNDRVVLTLNWEESGGPPVKAPERTGFGTRLIQSGFSDLGGEVDLNFNPTGLHCQIRARIPA